MFSGGIEIDLWHETDQRFAYLELFDEDEGSTN